MTDQPDLQPPAEAPLPEEVALSVEMPPPAGPPAAPPPMIPAPPAPAPAPAQAWSPAQAQGKSRVLAAALALLLGGIGIHKFYLGKIGQGIVYVLFCWTGIPALVGWIEGILYLLKSNESWAAEYGGAVEQPSGAAIGCVWLLVLVPLVSFVLSAIIALIFLGSGIASVSGY